MTGNIRVINRDGHEPPLLTSTRGSRRRASSRENPKRDWYVWSETDTRYQGVRIIFCRHGKCPIGPGIRFRNRITGHRFFNHQPDLNYDNPAVREAMWEVMKFWLDIGVDGFRLDAVPYLIERDGTSCENLPETHEIIRDLAQPRRLDLSRQNAVGGGQSVAGGRALIFR